VLGKTSDTAIIKTTKAIIFPNPVENSMSIELNNQYAGLNNLQLIDIANKVVINKQLLQTKFYQDYKLIFPTFLVLYMLYNGVKKK
jgi:hypothetical protein